MDFHKKSFYQLYYVNVYVNSCSSCLFVWLLVPDNRFWIPKHLRVTLKEHIWPRILATQVKFLLVTGSQNHEYICNACLLFRWRCWSPTIIHYVAKVPNSSLSLSNCAKKRVPLLNLKATLSIYSGGCPVLLILLGSKGIRSTM